jgi:hypothetical protein
MAVLAMFDTPGGLRDFPDGSAFYKEWHTEVNTMLGPGPFPGSLGPDTSPPRPVGQFYNPTVTNVNVAGQRVLVWMGFPRELLIAHRDQRQRAFEVGDTRGPDRPGMTTQVEYLEWRVTPQAGKIKKVTFVTETPEYWRKMFSFDRGVRVLELYRELVNPAITREQITNADGSYNELNVWNTAKGIVHYIVNSPANTLGAAIGLAKGSVVLTSSIADGFHVRDNYEVPATRLAGTSADPRVGLDVNDLARKDLSVTLREPIGIYMTAWDDTGWTKPDGSPVGNYWRVVRGRLGAGRLFSQRHKDRRPAHQVWRTPRRAHHGDGRRIGGCRSLRNKIIDLKIQSSKGKNHG